MPNPASPNYKYQEADEALGAASLVGDIAEYTAEEFRDKSNKDRLKMVGSIVGGLLMASVLVGGPIALHQELGGGSGKNDTPTKEEVGGHPGQPTSKELPTGIIVKK